MGYDWYEDVKKLYGIGRLSEIKAELDVLFQQEDVDWEKEFVTVRVYDVARDAAHREAPRYRGSKSFAASYMLIDGLHDERFKELYRKTYKMSKISGLVRGIVADKELEGIKTVLKGLPYEIEGVLGGKNSTLRVFRPLKTFVDNLCEDMEVDSSYVISVMVLKGSSKERYKLLFDKAMDKMYISQIINMEVKLSLARVMVELYGIDEEKEEISRMFNLESSIKKEWKVYNVSQLAVDIAKKVAKLKGVKIGDVVSDALVSQYGWVLGVEEDEQ